MSDEGFTSVPGSWSYSGQAAEHGAPARMNLSAQAVALRGYGYEVRRTRRGVLRATFMGEPTTMMTPEGAVDSVEGETFSVWIEPDGVIVRREDG